MDKRIVVFLLEGLSDVQALEYPVSMFLDEINEDIMPFFLRPINDKGDITNDPSVSQNEVLKRIPTWWNIENALRKNSLNLSDVVEVIHIIDIDGVYLDDERIIYSPIKKIQYYDDRIVCPNRDRIIDRNKHKRHSISELKSANSLSINKKIIPYSLFYFCCNIDHFTCGERNLVNNEKTIKAKYFAYSFKSGEEFLNFFLSEKNKCGEVSDYRSSWELLQNSGNSLSYCSNLHILLLRMKEKYCK